ncbi:methylenetetrahydrofolate reductase [Thermincola ferriacetica]
MKAGSRLEKVLNAGHFAVTGEINPPQNAEGKVIAHHGEMLRDYCDAINLADNQTAVVRLSSIASGIVLQQMGIEPNIHIVARDRNRIAIQSDVLGAAAFGIKNVLCLSGDHQTLGNHPTAKNVYDIDSIQMLKMLDGMRKGYFANGEEIKGPRPELFLGCAANPFGDPFEYRVLRLAKKIEAGADFVQTQSIFDMERFERWMEIVRAAGLHKKVKILAGVTPLKSWKAADFIKNKVAGMIVDDRLIERLKAAKDPQEEGIKICVEQINYLKTMEGIAGVHIMAVAWEEIIPEIVKRANLYPRPQIN